MALSSSNTNNYENIEITIDDIDDNIPLVVNNEHTVRNVFGGLNKIIQAIKNKITSVDTATKSWHQGKRGSITIDAFTLSANGTVSRDYLISPTEEYTHAYITDESSPTNRLYTSIGGGISNSLRYLSKDWCPFIVNTYMRRVDTTTYQNVSISYKLELINEDGGTYIRVSWTGNSSYDTLFPQTTYYYDCF